MISTSNQSKVKNVTVPGLDADGWFTPGRFAALLAVLIVGCFPQVIFGFETFYYRDFGAFAYPLALYHREAFWHGEMPLWNPYNHCGLPFLAQWNTLTLYPPSLFYLVFPLSWSLGIFNLAHMFWAGLGMYFLAHRWTGNRLAASVAGLVYAFNGLTWDALMWSNNIAALGWMPWVVLCVERAWREGGGRNLILASLAGAMQMLTGAPEVIILTWFAMGMLWLTEWLGKEAPRGKMILRILSVSILVVGLAAAQLLPFLDLLAYSQRDRDFADSTWSMPLGGWANYLVPLFHSVLGPQKVYFQDSQSWTASYYLGIGTVALALVAVWRVRERRMWVLAGLAVFSLTMALGDRGGVYAFARKVAPIMGFMRFPVKFVLLTTFVLPLLAAQAVSWWQALPETQSRLERKKLWQIGICLLGIMALILWWEWLIRRPPQTNPILTTNNALLRAAFLVSILGSLVLLRRIKDSNLQRLARVCLLLLFWFDVFTHAPNLNPTIERIVYEPDLTQKFHSSQNDSNWGRQMKLGVARAMPEWATLSRVTKETKDAADTDLFGRRLAFYCNYNLLDHAPKFDGFFSMDMREMDMVNRYMAPATTNNDLPRLKDFLGISHFNNPTNPVDWISRDTFLPMITTGQQPLFVDDAAALQAVTGTRFDPVRFVYLPPDAKRFITATNQAEAKILSHNVEAEHVEAEVEASAPAMMVVAQAYYHPWHAYVDGKTTPLFRANYAFQALEVPAGKHQVSLVYEDRIFKAGAIISLATLLLVGVGLFWLRRKAIT